MMWKPITTAPKDNARPLYLARFDKDGDMLKLDFDGGWEYWEESWELAHINGYAWVSSGGIEEPTHWAYQDEGSPPALPDNAGDNPPPVVLSTVLLNPLPCPFCGHVGLDFREGTTFRWLLAECGGCGATCGETRIQTLGQGAKDEWMQEAQQDAIAVWNTRFNAKLNETKVIE